MLKRDAANQVHLFLFLQKQLWGPDPDHDPLCAGRDRLTLNFPAPQIPFHHQISYWLHSHINLKPFPHLRGFLTGVFQCHSHGNFTSASKWGDGDSSATISFVNNCATAEKERVFFYLPRSCHGGSGELEIFSAGLPLDLWITFKKNLQTLFLPFLIRAGYYI